MCANCEEFSKLMNQFRTFKQIKESTIIKLSQNNVEENKNV